LKNKAPSEKVINVRGESIHEKPALKRAMMNMRCIIPADGFYAWKKIGKKTMIPYRFVLQKQELFSIAGIWEEFEDENEKPVHTFMMLTVPPNELVGVVDDRMPLILDKQKEKLWLKKDASEAELLSLIDSYPAAEMNFYTVSPLISQVNLDVPSLITPTPPADQFGNLTLFD
jgi:putative SOS response-associated peptidase YedK